jgi:predicted NUDIX family phosphoesterase
MNKMDEQIVVFNSRYLNYLDGMPGVVPHHLFQSNISQFMDYIAPTFEVARRGDVEDDPTFKQVIPYVVVCDRKDRFLVYNRGEEGGEKRLANKWSIGFGGHVGREDCRGDFPPALPGTTQRFMQYAAMRELTEELEGWPVPHAVTGDAPVSYEAVAMFNLAFIQLEDTPVNSVHFGVVMKAFCDLRYPEEIGPKSEIAEVKWVNRQDLFNYEMEDWSEKLKWHL